MVLGIPILKHFRVEHVCNNVHLVLTGIGTRSCCNSRFYQGEDIYDILYSQTCLKGSTREEQKMTA